MTEKEKKEKQEIFAKGKASEVVEEIKEINVRGRVYNLEKIRKWMRKKGKKSQVIPGHGEIFADGR